ncbi:hypothetical protein V8C86DRAFT_2689040, partial [Haematococcus lacustris]
MALDKLDGLQPAPLPSRPSPCSVTPTSLSPQESAALHLTQAAPGSQARQPKADTPAATPEADMATSLAGQRDQAQQLPAQQAMPRSLRRATTSPAVTSGRPGPAPGAASAWSPGFATVAELLPRNAGQASFTPRPIISHRLPQFARPASPSTAPPSPPHSASPPPTAATPHERRCNSSNAAQTRTKLAPHPVNPSDVPGRTISQQDGERGLPTCPPSTTLTPDPPLSLTNVRRRSFVHGGQQPAQGPGSSRPVYSHAGTASTGLSYTPSLMTNSGRDSNVMRAQYASNSSGITLPMSSDSSLYRMAWADNFLGSASPSSVLPATAATPMYVTMPAPVRPTSRAVDDGTASQYSSMLDAASNNIQRDSNLPDHWDPNHSQDVGSLLLHSQQLLYLLQSSQLPTLPTDHAFATTSSNESHDQQLAMLRASLLLAARTVATATAAGTSDGRLTGSSTASTVAALLGQQGAPRYGSATPLPGPPPPLPYALPRAQAAALGSGLYRRASTTAIEAPGSTMPHSRTATTPGISAAIHSSSAAATSRSSHPTTTSAGTVAGDSTGHARTGSGPAGAASPHSGIPTHTATQGPTHGISGWEDSVPGHGEVVRQLTLIWTALLQAAMAEQGQRGSTPGGHRSQVVPGTPSHAASPVPSPPRMAQAMTHPGEGGQGMGRTAAAEPTLTAHPPRGRSPEVQVHAGQEGTEEMVEGRSVQRRVSEQPLGAARQQEGALRAPQQHTSGKGQGQQQMWPSPFGPHPGAGPTTSAPDGNLAAVTVPGPPAPPHHSTITSLVTAQASPPLLTRTSPRSLAASTPANLVAATDGKPPLAGEATPGGQEEEGSGGLGHHSSQSSAAEASATALVRCAPTVSPPAPGPAAVGVASPGQPGLQAAVAAARCTAKASAGPSGPAHSNLPVAASQQDGNAVGGSKRAGGEVQVHGALHAPMAQRGLLQSNTLHPPELPSTQHRPTQGSPPRHNTNASPPLSPVQQLLQHKPRPRMAPLHTASSDPPATPSPLLPPCPPSSSPSSTPPGLQPPSGATAVPSLGPARRAPARQPSDETNLQILRTAHLLHIGSFGGSTDGGHGSLSSRGPSNVPSTTQPTTSNSSYTPTAAPTDQHLMNSLQGPARDSVVEGEAGVHGTQDMDLLRLLMSALGSMAPTSAQDKEGVEGSPPSPTQPTPLQHGLPPVTVFPAPRPSRLHSSPPLQPPQTQPQSRQTSLSRQGQVPHAEAAAPRPGDQSYLLQPQQQPHHQPWTQEDQAWMAQLMRTIHPPAGEQHASMGHASASMSFPLLAQMDNNTASLLAGMWSAVAGEDGEGTALRDSSALGLLAPELATLLHVSYSRASASISLGQHAGRALDLTRHMLQATGSQVGPTRNPPLHSDASSSCTGSLASNPQATPQASSSRGPGRAAAGALAVAGRIAQPGARPPAAALALQKALVSAAATSLKLATQSVGRPLPPMRTTAQARRRASALLTSILAQNALALAQQHQEQEEQGQQGEQQGQVGHGQAADASCSPLPPSPTNARQPAGRSPATNPSAEPPQRVASPPRGSSSHAAVLSRIAAPTSPSPDAAPPFACQPRPQGARSAALGAIEVALTTAGAQAARALAANERARSPLEALDAPATARAATPAGGKAAMPGALGALPDHATHHTNPAVARAEPLLQPGQGEREALGTASEGRLRMPGTNPAQYMLLLEDELDHEYNDEFDMVPRARSTSYSLASRGAGPSAMLSSLHSLKNMSSRPSCSSADVSGAHSAPNTNVEPRPYAPPSESTRSAAGQAGQQGGTQQQEVHVQGLDDDPDVAPSSPRPRFGTRMLSLTLGRKPGTPAEPSATAPDTLPTAASVNASSKPGSVRPALKGGAAKAGKARNLRFDLTPQTQHPTTKDPLLSGRADPEPLEDVTAEQAYLTRSAPGPTAAWGRLDAASSPGQTLAVGSDVPAAISRVSAGVTDRSPSTRSWAWGQSRGQEPDDDQRSSVGGSRDSPGEGTRSSTTGSVAGDGSRASKRHSSKGRVSRSVNKLAASLKRMFSSGAV